MVTKTRFVVGAQTFALAGITSVRGLEMQPRPTIPTLLLVLSVLLLAGFIRIDKSVAYVTVPTLVVSIAWLYLQKPTIAARLTSRLAKASASRERGVLGRSQGASRVGTARVPEARRHTPPVEAFPQR